MFNVSHFYLTHTIHGSKNISLVIPQNTFYYAALHIRFSTIFYSVQLVDLFSYELPLLNSQKFVNHNFVSHSLDTTNSVVVYNFHNLTFQDRFFFFCSETSQTYNKFHLNSISELYPNAGWLEREVAELHGTTFNNKKDLRNLMLQYGDTSTPFKKSSPSIGTKEVFYDSLTDLVVQNPISLQS